MDKVLWWADYLSDELDGCAEVVYEARAEPGAVYCPGESGARAIVTVTPSRSQALPFTVRAGGPDVPTISFGNVTEVRCFGFPPTAKTAGLDPSNHLGVLVAALVSDGAALVKRTGRRQILVLGPLDGHPELAARPVIQSWSPFAEHYGTMSMFRRPPDYDGLPPAAFAVPVNLGSIPRRT
jgi:hypothetical protein